MRLICKRVLNIVEFFSNVLILNGIHADAVFIVWRLTLSKNTPFLITDILQEQSWDVVFLNLVTCQFKSSDTSEYDSSVLVANVFSLKGQAIRPFIYGNG